MVKFTSQIVKLYTLTFIAATTTATSANLSRSTPSHTTTATANNQTNSTTTIRTDRTTSSGGE